MQVLSIEEDFRIIANNDKHPFHSAALKFQKYTSELASTAAGQEWLQMFYVFCGHPMCHAPQSDPVIAAHLSGRHEVTAFLARRASDAAIPNFPEIKQPTIPQHHGQTNKRRNRTPKGGVGEAAGSKH